MKIKMPSAMHALKQIAAPTVVTFVLAFLISMSCSITPWSNIGPGTDSAVFRYVAQVMFNGGMPYADTFDHKGPLIYVINLIGMSIAHLRGVWFLEFAVLWISTIGMYRTARLFTTHIGALVSVIIACSLLLTCLEGGNLVEEYALPFIAWSLYIFFDYLLNQRFSSARVIVCGLFCGCILLLRPNMLSVWVVFCIVTIIQCIMMKKYRELVLLSGKFALGIVIAILPVAIWLIAGGAIDDFFQDYIAFNFLYSTNDNSGNIVVERWGALCHFTNNAIAIVSISVSAYLALRKGGAANWAQLFCLIVTYLSICLSGRLYEHYAIVAIAPLCASVAQMTGMRHDSWDTPTKGASLAVTCYLALIVAAPLWIQATNDTVQDFLGQRTSYSATTEKVCDLVRNHTSINDGISIYGNWDAIYVLTRRESISLYSYQEPIKSIDSAIMEHYFSDLAKKHPKILVVGAECMDNPLREFLNKEPYTLIWEESPGANAVKVFEYAGQDIKT